MNKPQSQESLIDQLIELIPIAQQNGLYDERGQIKSVTEYNE